MELTPKAKECVDKAKAIGWDLDLTTIKALLAQLDNPQNKIKTVHITGTNGKGSTAAFLTQMLINAGYTVGRYTSPAVENELERYTINNSWISQSDYCGLLEAISIAAEILTRQGFRYPSLFEVETVLAFLFFSLSKCDINIIEVGMGGALDATNVISNTAICVFTSIGLDHQAWLGDSLTDIAKNKAGIVKYGSIIVSTIQNEEVSSVLNDVAKANNCPIYFAKPLKNICKLSLVGSFQYINAALACECAQLLNTIGFEIDHNDITNALTSTVWPFRFETISNKPLVILDGAHNLPAIIELKKTIKQLYVDKKLTFIVSVLKDKNYEEMFKEIIPMANNVITIQSQNDRALNGQLLTSSIQKYCNNVFYCENSDDAVEKAYSLKDEAIICFGTFTFLSEMKKAFEVNKID